MNKTLLKDYPVLYSLGTKLAYKIDNEFYGRKHFVWCTIHFHSDGQAPSSDPYNIAKRYLSQVLSGDKHDPFIKGNMAGILRGAKAHYQGKTITTKDYYAIRRIVNVAEYSHFMPILYIIDSKKVINRARIIEKEKTASNTSVELVIEDLCENEFEIIDFSSLLNDFIHPFEGRVNVV